MYLLIIYAIHLIGFTYQFWIKPYVLTVDRTQLIIGNLVYDEARRYNNGVILEYNQIRFYVGNNFFDVEDYSNSKYTLF